MNTSSGIKESEIEGGIRAAKSSASSSLDTSQDLKAKATSLEMRIKKSRFLNFFGAVVFCCIILFQFFFSMFEEELMGDTVVVFGEAVASAAVASAAFVVAIIALFLLALLICKFKFATKKDMSNTNTYAKLEVGVATLEKQLSQSHFFTLGGALVFLDIIVFQSFGENWAAPISILFIELVLIIVVGDILGIKSIGALVNKAFFALGRGGSYPDGEASEASAQSTTSIGAGKHAANSTAPADKTPDKR